MLSRDFYQTHANLNALGDQLQQLEQCARQEHGSSVRVALLLTLIGIVRALLREVQSLSDRIDALDDELADRAQ